MSKLAGWIAIALALLASAIGMVPGAVALMGWAMSLLAMFVSLFSVKRHGTAYFVFTAGIVLTGTFLANAVLNAWDPLPMPSSIKIGMYSGLFLVLFICAFAAHRWTSQQRRSGKDFDKN